MDTISDEQVKADYVSSQVQYTGKTGKNKTISLFPNKVTFDINKSLVTDFDLIFAIDTNTKEFNNELISISSVFHCNAKIDGERGTARCKGINMCFKNAPINEPEKIACARLIKIITDSEKYNEKHRIAIITDHDLCKHAKYNNGELPIYGDIYLPSNITILYARDKPNENIMNKLISECNNYANKYLKQLNENGFIDDINMRIALDQIPDMKDDKEVLFFIGT
jgi:hypothetical protein